MSKITQSARGEDCTLMIYPYCLRNPETVVLCHLPSEDSGQSIKSPDWWGVYGCSECHAIIDGRRRTVLNREEIQACILRALYRTHKRLIDLGLLKA